MNNEDKDLTFFWLSYARESIEEANVLLREDMSYRSVMNRLYYAMFYVVLALLNDKGLSTSKHRGALHLFDLEFIKTSIFSKELTKVFHQGFNLRLIGDYSDQIEITKEDIDKIMPKAQNFVKKIEEYLLKKIEDNQKDNDLK